MNCPTKVERTVTAGVSLATLLSVGCSSKSAYELDARAQNDSALNRSAVVELMVPGSNQEEQSLERFTAFYEVYSEDAIRENLRELYADDAWFGDPFHIVEGIDEIEAYFIAMAEPVESCTFDMHSIQRSERDYFARWTMKLESKAARGDVIEAIGMSHLRFNRQGQVIFHQDYWDTSVMMDRLPVVGFWTRLVKGRIEKGVNP